MQIDVPLDRPREAERLRTAVYRFSEMKASPAPPVVLRADDRGMRGAVSFWSDEAASEFRGYWRTFQQERQDFSGFRDV